MVLTVSVNLHQSAFSSSSDNDPSELDNESSPVRPVVIPLFSKQKDFESVLSRTASELESNDQYSATFLESIQVEKTSKETTFNETGLNTANGMSEDDRIKQKLASESATTDFVLESVVISPKTEVSETITNEQSLMILLLFQVTHF